MQQYQRAQSQGHHAVDHLEEGGVERGSARRSSLKGRERPVVNRTNVELFQGQRWVKRRDELMLNVLRCQLTY